MFNWAKQQLANVAGTQEPIYGPSHIRSVAEQAQTIPYTELTRDDMKWHAMESTSVETFSFYLLSSEGHIGLAQVIYSNVMGVHKTAQFNTKIFYPNQSLPNLWCSDQLLNTDFSDDRCNFYADNVAVELSPDGLSYSIKSMTNSSAVVNLTIRRTAPGFVVGKDGKTLYGADMEQPWGLMRHAFWPTASCEGSIMTKEGPVKWDGKAMFVHALQGMKPHHAAAKWNFVDFQGPNYSAVMMEYTTPASYGSTVVAVGGIIKDGEILVAGSNNKVTHTAFNDDKENEWPEPSAVKYEWHGKTKDGKEVTAVMEGQLEKRLDKVDVMAEVPKFVKQFVAGAVGTKPYIYQYAPTVSPLALKVKVDGEEEVTETGRLFCESTFISEA